MIPCKDCLVLAICRHKTFSKLLSECILIKSFDNKYMERDEDDYFKSILMIEGVLNPTKWVYANSEYRNPFLTKEREIK